MLPMSSMIVIGMLCQATALPLLDVSTNVAIRKSTSVSDNVIQIDTIQDDPSAPADTILDTPKPGTHLVPRQDGQTVLWHALTSDTSVLLSLGYAIPGNGVTDLLSAAVQQLQNHMQTVGDGTVPKGLSHWTLNGIGLWIESAGEQQQTWSMLYRGLITVQNYMESHPWRGAASFKIYEGVNLVGTGDIG